jgi:hypothetical protein
MAKSRILPKSFRLGFSENWNSTTKSINYPNSSIMSLHLEKLLRNQVKRFYKKQGWWDFYKLFLKMLEKTNSFQAAHLARPRFHKQLSYLNMSIQFRRRVALLPGVFVHIHTAPEKFFSLTYSRTYGKFRRMRLRRELIKLFYWRVFTWRNDLLFSDSLLYNTKSTWFNAFNSIKSSVPSVLTQRNSSNLTKKFFSGYQNAVVLVNLALEWRNPMLLSHLIANNMSGTRNVYRILNIFKYMLPNFLKLRSSITGLHIRYRGAFAGAPRAKDVIHTTRRRAQKLNYQTLDNPMQFFCKQSITFRGIISVSIWIF